MSDLTTRILDHVGNTVPPILRQTVSERIAGELLREASEMPYPIGSIVDGEYGRYLVAELSYENCGSQPASYSLRGHPELGTTPDTHAWHAHGSLTLVDLPTRRSWDMLKDAVSLDQQSRTYRAHV